MVTWLPQTSMGPFFGAMIANEFRIGLEFLRKRYEGLTSQTFYTRLKV